jgi:hypothetical protein
VALVAAALVLLPLYSSLSGNIFILTLFTRIIIFALAAGQPQPHHGLWRHDELWPCRLSRHRRLCRSASSLRGHWLRLHPVAGGAGGLRRSMRW